MRMIAMLTIYDLAWSIGNFIVPIAYYIAKGGNFNIGNHVLLCNLSSFYYIFTLLGSIWWTSMICHQILLAFKETKHSNKYYYSFYVNYGVLVPGIFAIM